MKEYNAGPIIVNWFLNPPINTSHKIPKMRNPIRGYFKLFGFNRLTINPSTSTNRSKKGIVHGINTQPEGAQLMFSSNIMNGIELIKYTGNFDNGIFLNNLAIFSLYFIIKINVSDKINISKKNPNSDILL